VGKTVAAGNAGGSPKETKDVAKEMSTTRTTGAGTTHWGTVGTVGTYKDSHTQAIIVLTCRGGKRPGPAGSGSIVEAIKAMPGESSSPFAHGFFVAIELGRNCLIRQTLVRQEHNGIAKSQPH
jgi:hypothetical protein